ncbi:MAG: glycosyltransferase family A protein [Candidatus Omnitrophica bacterium]|jgi:glycosyltransferase involved in cell wall biosynthesis|nr:glycosyltransferase family A protein [Candidatus Omnitrophota bacterium]
MKFSIIIPLYNGSRFIEATLDSVLAQTYKDYEIILVNDGSPDNVEEIVQRYISKHSGTCFIYRKQENKGLGAARNAGIREATGDIIAILDQDDIWYQDKLAKVAEIYKSNPEINVICHSQNVRSNGNITRVFRPEPIKGDVYRQMLFDNKFADNIFSTSAVTFSRVVEGATEFFSEDRTNMHFVEDYDLLLRMAKAGRKFYSSNLVLGECSKHDSNFSKELDTMLKGELCVLKEHYKRYADLNKIHLMAWYLMRRRRALVYFRASKEYFRSKRAGNGIKYLMLAFCADPIFLSYYFQKAWYAVRNNKE